MIRSIEGLVTHHTDTTVVLSVHGIGYLVHSNVLKYQPALGDRLALHTYLAVRETALDLYGFKEEKELQMFELLLSVPKIGPKSALVILGQANPDLLATAIIMNDAEHLHTVSGIGKKTASNIVTHLAGKVDALSQNISGEVGIQTNQLTSNQADAIEALTTLGYDQKEARASVLKLDKTLDAKEIIQAVLKQL
jgi:holliday junction DNA helicase RuvA